MSFIGFSVSKKKFPIFGWAIQALQKGRYSHCFISFTLMYGKQYVIDATGHGVRVRTIEMFLKENKIVKKYKIYNCSSNNGVNLLYWGLSKSGQKYPLVEVFGNLVQLISLRVFGKRIKNPFGKGDNKPRCNELVAIALKEIFDHDIKADLDSIDLIWLDEYLKDYGLSRF